MSTNRARWDRETRPIFAKRHYEFIADLINDFSSMLSEKEQGTVIDLINLTCQKLKEDNFAFNRTKFESRARGGK